MNLSTTIIGLAILALFAIPVFLIAKSAKKKIEKLKDSLTDEAKKTGVTIADTDYWNDSILGIDDREETVIYIDGSHSEREISTFNMRDVKSVRFFPDITKNPNPDYKKEPKLGISFFFKETAKSEVNVMFFMAGFGDLSKHEQGLFEKWTGKIKKIRSAV